MVGKAPAVAYSYGFESGASGWTSSGTGDSKSRPFTLMLSERGYSFDDIIGQLKLDPLWDPLRKDPRLDKLLAELAPTD